MDSMWKLLALCGIGVGALMLYKIQNPDCLCDMKESLDKLTKNAGNKVKNMME